MKINQWLDTNDLGFNLAQYSIGPRKAQAEFSFVWIGTSLDNTNSIILLCQFEIIDNVPSFNWKIKGAMVRRLKTRKAMGKYATATLVEKRLSEKDKINLTRAFAKWHPFFIDSLLSLQNMHEKIRELHPKVKSTNWSFPATPVDGALSASKYSAVPNVKTGKVSGFGCSLIYETTDGAKAVLALYDENTGLGQNMEKYLEMGKKPMPRRPQMHSLHRQITKTMQVAMLRLPPIS